MPEETPWRYITSCIKCRKSICKSCYVVSDKVTYAVHVITQSGINKNYNISYA